MASSAFGTPRTTLDVDIIAGVKFEHVAEIEDSFKNEFYVDAEMIRNAIKHQSSFNLIHFETMFKVDVFILKNDTYSSLVFSRRKQKEVSEDTSTKLYFSAPEDIILIKLQWNKSLGQGSDRQWSDILGVLKVQGIRLDLDYMSHWAGELGVFKLLKTALQDAGLPEQ